MKYIILIIAVFFFMGCATEEEFLYDALSEWEAYEGDGVEIVDTPSVDLSKPSELDHDPVDDGPIQPVEVAVLEGTNIPLSAINWIGCNVSKWPVTSKLNVTVSGNKITFDYDKAGIWPAVIYRGKYVSANPWIIFKHKGKWTASSIEWLRPGQKVKSIKCVSGDHMPSHSLQGWKPKSGDELYFFEAGLSRGGMRNARERTNIKKVVW